MNKEGLGTRTLDMYEMRVSLQHITPFEAINGPYFIIICTREEGSLGAGAISANKTSGAKAAYIGVYIYIYIWYTTA